MVEKAQRVMKKVNNTFKKPLLKYILLRTFDSFITLLLIVTAVFLLMRLLPKERYIDKDALKHIPVELREDFIQKTYEKLGLSGPVYEQLFNYYKELAPIPKEICNRYVYADSNFSELVCDPSSQETVYVYLGKSITYKKGADVSELIFSRFPLSFKLSMYSIVVTYALGYPLGVLMAKNKGKLADKLGNGYIVLTNAVPGLIFYYIWLILGMNLKLPSIFDESYFISWIMPVWALSFVSIAGTAMWVRRYMVDEINSDYVKFARSKGLPERRIMYTHVLRNAIVPLIRNFPTTLIFAVVGSYFVEMLWNIPGSGGLLKYALDARDNPLVQGLTLVYSAMSMIASLLGDIVTVFFDPRISLTKNK